MNERDWLTPEEVAHLLKVQKATVWKWLREGQMIAPKFGKQYRIPKDEYHRFEQEHLTWPDRV